jgi:Glucose / Sorbosone dehydrogenase/Putative binding domain, N-terminal
VIAEYAANPANANVAGTAEKILLIIPHPTYDNHNGGMLAFGPDGFLYIGVGDGGFGDDPDNNAQNKNTLLGKILRINVDQGATYSIPADNPFNGAVEGLDEIFAYGLRNPWRFSFDRVNGQGWVGDVGQGAREEVDTPLENGDNYGWRIFEGTRCTEIDACDDPPNYVPPLFDYEHTGGRCSLTGGYVYRGSASAVETGTYIYGDFCSGEILAWDGSSQRLLLDTAMRISSFGEDEQGEVYVVDLNGSINRIVSGVTCSYSISPTRTTIGPAGGTGTVTITTAAGCAWTATNNASWLGVAPGSGAGPQTVTYAVDPYSGKPKKRNGSLTIAGQTFTVQQSR